MKRTISCCLVYLFLSAPNISLAQPDIQSTQAVLMACENSKSPDARTRLQAVAHCQYRVSGFIEGFRLGADRGVYTVFIHDKEAMETMKGFDDLMARSGALRDKARCLPTHPDIDEVIYLWTMHVKFGTDDLKTKHYSTTLRDAIENNYCRN